MIFDNCKIKELREAQGLSIRGLADKIGIHPNVVLQWEQGRTAPSMASLERIVNSFGVSPEYFFVDEGACEQAADRGNGGKP